MARAGIKVELLPTNRMFLMTFNVQRNILYLINTPPQNGEFNKQINFVAD